MADPVSAILVAAQTLDAATVLITALSALAVKLATTLAAIIAASSVVAKYLPPPPPGSALEKAYSILNKLAQNGGYAANKEAAE
jgi:hypothetical protein